MAPTTASRMQQQYLEAQVFSADPLQLVRLLYRGAIDAVAAARRHLAAGKITERSQQITRAWQIIYELSISLNRDAGGELAEDLIALYAYIGERLLEANQKQTDGPLAEVERLLSILAEGWRDISTAAAAA